MLSVSVSQKVTLGPIVAIDLNGAGIFCLRELLLVQPELVYYSVSQEATEVGGGWVELG